MTSFRLELLADDPTSKPQSCGTIVERAYRFRDEYCRRHPEKKDQRLDVLLRDVTDGRFWGVLSLIDGSYHHTQPDSLEKRHAARQWAHEQFDHHELQELLTIAINYARLVPVKTGWPGTYHGHSILYRELVEKKDSLFSDNINDTFRKRLNNGRLWEMLPDLSPGLNNCVAYVIVGDVLEHHFDDIDPAFFQKGFEIFKREYRTEFDLCWLSDKQINQYVRFVELVHEHKDRSKLTDKDIAQLLIPYLKIIVSVHGINHEDYGLPRFEEGKKGIKSFRQRLQEPFVAAQLVNNDDVRTALAHDLSDTACWGCGNASHVFDVAQHVPNPHEFLCRMLAHHGDNKELISFLKKIQK